MNVSATFSANGSSPKRFGPAGTFHAGPNQKQDRPKRHENNQIPAAGVVDVVLPATGHCEARDENRQEIGDEHGRNDYRRRSLWRRRRKNFDAEYDGNCEQLEIPILRARRTSAEIRKILEAGCDRVRQVHEKLTA